MNNVIEMTGYALMVAFLWFLWPPLVLLGSGALVVVWANVRQPSGRTAAAISAAVSAARLAYRQQAELRRVA